MNPEYHGRKISEIQKMENDAELLHYQHRIIWELKEALQIPEYEIKDHYEYASYNNESEMISYLWHLGSIPEYLQIEKLKGVELKELIINPLDSDPCNRFFKTRKEYKLDNLALIFPVKYYGNWAVHNLNTTMNKGFARVFIPGKNADPIQIQSMDEFLFEQYGYKDPEKHRSKRLPDTPTYVEFRQKIEDV